MKIQWIKNFHFFSENKYLAACKWLSAGGKGLPAGEKMVLDAPHRDAHTEKHLSAGKQQHFGR
jgi:hypothetical protein